MAAKTRPAARAEPRAARAETAPEPVRAAVPPAPVIPPPTAVRAPPGRAVAIGRDGKPIWRHNAQGGADPFAIDPAIPPAGWVYEWKRYSVMGQVDHSYQANVQRIGRWSPVMAETHDGVFLPPGTTGAIIVDGLILMERPIELHDEARQDERSAANDVMQKARRERGLQVPQGVTGVSTQTAAARGASYVNVGRAFDSQEDKEALAAIPRPAYEYERNTID